MPDVPENLRIGAIMREAMAQHRIGRLAAAESLYRQAMLVDATDADIRHNLGIALAQQGKFAAAAPHLVAALEKHPERSHYWKAALEALQSIGDLEGQAALYRRLVVLQPQLAPAHYNLGNVLRDLNRLDEAEAAWKSAVKLDTAFARAHNNLGSLAKYRGDLDGAEFYFRAAIAAAPDFPAAHCNLGTVLEQKGILEEAEHCYRETLALEPGHLEARRYLGAVVCEQGRLREALEIFMDHARLCDGAAGTSPHKEAHDREQRAWLGDPGIYVTRLSILGGEREPGGAVKSQFATGAANAWKESNPRVLVIDDLLTTQALESLQRFCLGSTVWRQSFPGGYLGALPEHGFAVPLLAQIGEELADAFPEIFDGHPLLQLWAFKYGSGPHGIKLHADFAAVNVNFWITPDSANRDPEHGGLVVWDKPAPLDWDFETYNNDEQAIRDFLEQSGARSITVPYRANRAVVFDSDLFHETDVIDFREGYENRRINVTFLYGWRGNSRTARG